MNISELFAEMRAASIPFAALESKSEISTVKSLKSPLKPVLKFKSSESVEESARRRTELSNLLEANASDDFVRFIQRDVNLLSDEDPSSRKKSFGLLCDLLIKPCDSPCEGAETYKIALDHVLKPALKRFIDPIEYCRECAIRLVTEYIRIADDTASALPYLIPVLMYRVLWSPEGGGGRAEARTEESEELRLLLARLLLLTIQRLTVDVLARALGDLTPLLISQLSDPYAAVKQESCACLRWLADCDALLEPLKGVSLLLIAALVPVLVHRHSKLRVAALEALTPLLYARGAEMIRELTGFREANVIPIKAFYQGAVCAVADGSWSEWGIPESANLIEK